jgi:lactate racemase
MNTAPPTGVDTRRQAGPSSDDGRAWVWSGRRRLPVPLPGDFVPAVALTCLDDVAASLTAELDAPLGAPRLRDLARDARSIALVIPDASRKTPNAVVLAALLEELTAAGLPYDAVTVVIGCGLHRTTTAKERLGLVGESVAGSVRVVDAQGLESPQAALGATSLGCPVSVARVVADADLVVTVGVVEPHLYAGFSGGVKGVAIGCAGEATIGWTHAPAFISRPGVELVRLTGNPFQDTLREVAARTRLRFAVNVVGDAGGGVACLLAGDPAAVQAELTRRYAPAWLHEVDEPYDLLFAGVAAPKDENLYQASRAATYVGLAGRPAVRDGGLIVLCADLPAGAGDGPGERNFAAVLSGAADLDELIARGLRGPLGPGGQRAFVVARVLRRFRVAVVGSGDPGLLASLGIERYDSVEEAAAAARPPDGGAPRTLIVADAMSSVVRASC